MTLDTMDLAWAVRRLPARVRDLLKKHGPRVFLAGGYVRATIANEKVSDIDLFCGSRHEAQIMAVVLADTMKVYESPNAFSVPTKPVMTQFIHRWTFEHPEAAIASFDFTIAQAAIWYDGTAWQSICSDRFYSDLAGKRLVYTSPVRDEEPGGSMLRVLKFYQKGYRIPLNSLGAVIARLCSGVREDGWRDQSHAAQVITGLLHDVDPAIDPDHIAHLPSTDSSVESPTVAEPAQAPVGLDS